MEDILGRQIRKKVEDLLPKLEKQTQDKAKAVVKKSKTISEKWLNDF